LPELTKIVGDLPGVLTIVFDIDYHSKVLFKLIQIELETIKPLKLVPNTLTCVDRFIYEEIFTDLIQ
jgi:hypothetical protein